ncbi:putative poly(beta-D-mannuronate) O-acetylase [Labilithrix luteola]|uniref:Putative poly(Beta-D-mannuronate) O-acetylase n=1 Tax=Labilithrix luteola TaxID=1391654 RepID=A0A0K1PYU2_9BACT|nr:MBOAT family O-acyltransferase [Labilithrix luteola]AKU98695.1 putative poly(beta-D-mannuronate) O-acetylase [Labilithrix luteola]
MRLDSGAFIALFAIFFLVYSAAPSPWKRWMLVAGSVAFYATLNPRYVPLLVGLGVFTFVIASYIHRETIAFRRDVLLWVGVGVDLLVFVFFKGAAPAAHALSALGVGSSSLLQVAVPLGVSFYTLQAIGCLIDVHRRVYEPPQNLVSFLASFTLFPHLLAGPIVRSSFLVPLVEKVDAVAWPTARRALLLFMVGLVKKGIADKLAPVADAAFDAVHPISSLEAWTGLFAYAAQLYGDFSGYTDMATALALLLGLDLPPNFDLPYLATSPADFWRRWHISLSSWLRDYVYIPLGVRLRRRRYTNLVATWIVAGLWHGLSPLFALYGLYHGVLLAGTDWLSRRVGGDDEVRGIRRVAQTALTLYLVFMGYVLFRARDVSAAGRYFVALHAFRAPSGAVRGSLSVIAACVAAVVFGHLLDHAMRRSALERPWILWPAMAVAVTCLALVSGAAQPFIYAGF